MRFALIMLGLTLTLLVGSFVVSSSAQCLTGTDSPATMNSNAKNMMSKARLGFALKALKEAAVINGAQSNLFFSPYSIHQALTLAYFGARNTTEKSLKEALQIPEELSKVDVQRSYSLEKLLDQKAEELSNSSYEYRSANRLWISSEKRVRQCMLDLFSSELQEANFKDNPDATRKEINDWVSDTTKGEIKDLIPLGVIDTSTDLVLANAVYFKGLWRSRFDTANSEANLFYGTHGPSSITFMRQNGTFNHVASEKLGAHILELPYNSTSDEISMYIFLPPSVTTKPLGRSADKNSTVNSDVIQQLLHRITETERGIKEFLEILEYDMQERELQISLPRFTVEQDLQVSSLLEALKADEILSDRADLHGFLADGEENLHLGGAVHRAKVQVNEEGTTAAAATVLFSFRASRPLEPMVFNADHPFLYIIYNKRNQAILFAGIYRDPTTPSESAATPQPKPAA